MALKSLFMDIKNESVVTRTILYFGLRIEMMGKGKINKGIYKMFAVKKK